MKIVRTIFLVFFLIVFNVSNVLAQDSPNPGDGDSLVPPLPINEHLLLLGLSAVILGSVVMYKRRKI
jgi:hypothetical protein